MHWQTTRFRIDLSSPRVMGVVNVTPDSFSDGGSHDDARSAIAHCEQLLREGADLLDIGGESTRPGARPVPMELELERVMPVLAVALQLGCPVAVDTRKADIEALQGADALSAIARHPLCGVCLMHKRGTPESMQQQPRYVDVVAEVGAFLRERYQVARAHGVDAERIVLDPGIGFGKSVEHNLELLRRQRELLTLGAPLLVGWSRKSTLGAVTGRDVSQRLGASLAAALAAVQGGARVLRVHDVAATVDALKVWQAAGMLMQG
jgi:dihydropteroate synthase